MADQDTQDAGGRPGFLHGVLRATQARLAQDQANNQRQKDLQAQVYWDIIRNGTPSADATPQEKADAKAKVDYANQQLQKIYGSKGAKDILGRVGQLFHLAHGTHDAQGSAQSSAGAQVLAPPTPAGAPADNNANDNGGTAAGEALSAGTLAARGVLPPPGGITTSPGASPGGTRSGNPSEAAGPSASPPATAPVSAPPTKKKGNQTSQFDFADLAATAYPNQQDIQKKAADQAMARQMTLHEAEAQSRMREKIAETAERAADRGDRLVNQGKPFTYIGDDGKAHIKIVTIKADGSLVETDQGLAPTKTPKESPDEVLAREMKSGDNTVSEIAKAKFAKLQAQRQKAEQTTQPKNPTTVVRAAADDPGLDKDAWTNMLGGPLNVVRGKGATEAGELIKARESQIMRDLHLSAADVMERRATFKANMPALAAITTQGAKIDSFERTLKANVATAEKLSQQFQRGDLRLWNRVKSAYMTGVGDPEALNLAAQLHGIAREWGKIMQGSVSANGVHVSEANAADEFFDKGISNGQLSSLIHNVILVDAQNRKNANDGAQQELLNRIRGTFSAPNSNGGSNNVDGYAVKDPKTGKWSIQSAPPN